MAEQLNVQHKGAKGRTLCTEKEIVSFLWNFFISREAATAERRYKKERWSENYMHLVQGRVYSSLSPPPPPLTPPSNAITRAAGLRAISAPPPPHPPPPPEDYEQILATSPKVEDGLHFGDCEYGS